MLRAREPSIIKFKTLTNNNRQTKLLKKLRRNKNTDNSIKQRGLNLVKQKRQQNYCTKQSLMPMANGIC
jgi:hypothetical protein